MRQGFTYDFAGKGQAAVQTELVSLDEDAVPFSGEALIAEMLDAGGTAPVTAESEIEPKPTVQA